MTDPELDAVLRGLVRYAEGLGLTEADVLVVYGEVIADTTIAPADRSAEVRRRLLTAAM